METIRGRRSLDLDLTGLNERLTNYNRVMLDLGTGDGRYVHYLADHFPDAFVIGVDSCRENLREYSRAKSPNMLFVIAAAQELPPELNGCISHLTINFPWGSLLESLLMRDPKLFHGLSSLVRQNAYMEIHLNSGALAEAGSTLGTGTARIADNLSSFGWQIGSPVSMHASDLRSIPTTWAKRLAYGRDPQAIALSGYFDCK